MAGRTFNGLQGNGYYENSTGHHQHEAEMPADSYNMGHRNRGAAIILSQENFNSRLQLRPRTGTKADEASLSRVLERLGFVVQIHRDKPFVEIEEIIKEVSLQNHKHNDCLLLACLTHGEKGCLYAEDSLYRPEKLWLPFTADKCPSLAGKPKLFFIEAGQGDELDEGIKLTLQADSSYITYRIPTHADFLVAYSTVPGYHSWAPARGSWFIQTLSEELSENGFTHDILDLLTNVNRKVAVECASYEPDNDERSFKQIPCINCMLTRELMFSEKNNIEESTL